jgi:acetyl esterase/lipase
MASPPLDPELAFLADLEFGLNDATIDVSRVRALLDELIYEEEPVAGVTVGHRTVGADPDVPVETFMPSGAGPHPCLLWFHGGGYLFGKAAMDADRLQRWSGELGCASVSVDYRLAPEHPFPAAHDDAMKVLEWLIASPDALDIDPSRIVVAGASAGGGLAAATVLAARDRGIPLAGQLLFYPMIDDRQQTPSSRWTVPVWPTDANEFAWRAYLNDRYGGDVPAYAAPARATRFDGLPPTLIIVGGADGFFDEDVDYATRLTRAGILTDLRVAAGAPHGFDLMAPAARATVDVLRAASEWLDARFSGEA